ncbi:PBS lyase HEAT domain protein repeat-containing protein [[Leptolyngbya] sp. PCC 7376]|uniref:HEAT repeat domain-containing protein n=1 Tax=[Leptolyngbya] sp. PCC 7376 TaxID=111781 RepID=UPI00029F38F3|nr:HEAT repeat domain-containing protein [[Leptolyngbya] sp. PCC 7376]AFY37555.1 PBS lyase HEAT domain protein repeat-containing protein [[Leptolyngbya] sp. PCC 7376]
MSQDTLFEQLKNPNPHLRDRAMWEIVESKDDNTIPRLMSVLDETDTTYRRAAVKTIGAVGVETVPFLVETLRKSDNGTVRSSCAKALAQVALNYPEETFPEIGIEGLKESLQDENPVVNIASAMAMGVVGVPALDSLLDVLNSTDNVALGVAIINALSAIKDDRAIETLKRIAEDENSDMYMKQMAESAFSRMDMLKGMEPK